jgi:hypothetical protein
MSGKNPSLVANLVYGPFRPLFVACPTVSQHLGGLPGVLPFALCVGGLALVFCSIFKVHLQGGLYRFSELAKMLIHNTQGKDNGATGEGQVSYDDVSVFVIPLHSQAQEGSGH